MIEVRDLGITLGEFTLDSINLTVNESEYAVVLGPTGSGKTVLIECIVGIHKPSRGSIHLDGVDVTDLKPEERHVAYVPQDYCLFPHMTVRQNIEFGMRRQKMPDEQIAETVKQLTSLMRIEGILARHPLTLSGGEKQRAALSRALAVKPRLLLLDEPLAAVDERTKEHMCQELKSIQQELGTTTIHVSHNFEETLAVADKIAIFERGRIVQVGTPDNIFRAPDTEFVARFTGSENLHLCQLTDGVCCLNGEADSGVLETMSQGSGSATMVIRPEDIRLHAADFPAGSNVLYGNINAVIDKGALYKVLVKVGGLEWAVLISRREYFDLQVCPGLAVSIELPAESIHIIQS